MGLKALSGDKGKGKEDRGGASVVAVEVGLLEATRSAYRNLQLSWFEFAKNLKEVKDAEAWAGGEHEFFKHYCEAEFTALSFATITKFLRVVDEMGPALEARKTKSLPLPSSDTCYEFLVHEDKLPKDEVPRMRKAIMDGSLTRSGVRERVASLVEKTVKKAGETRAAETAAIEKEVERSARRPAVVVEIDVDEDLDGDIELMAEEMLARVNYLNDNLPILTDSMESGSETIVSLATGLHKLGKGPLEAYLARVEEITA